MGLTLKNFNIMGGSLKNAILRGVHKNHYIKGELLKKGSLDGLQISGGRGPA